MKNAAWFVALAGALYWLSQNGLRVPGLALSRDEVRALIEKTTSEHGMIVDPEMALAICKIESGFNPTAIRLEPFVSHIGGPDTSAGLFQTLHSTAIWLAEDMGRSFYGKPGLDDLFDPVVSTYFGCAYLHWLGNYRGYRQSEDWIVRAYNGGPGWEKASTDNYWVKYLAARYGV